MTTAQREPISLGRTAGPWIESREGMLFFANALLVFPQISVFFPLLLGSLLESLGVAEGLQEILSVVPTIAAFVLPIAGFFFLLPLWFTLRARRITRRPSARVALLVFAAAHASFVLYALWSWASGGPAGGPIG